MDVEKIMQFILEHQAAHAAAISVIEEKIVKIENNLDRVVGVLEGAPTTSTKPPKTSMLSFVSWMACWAKVLNSNAELRSLAAHCATP
jgi:hypothetical protein